MRYPLPVRESAGSSPSQTRIAQRLRSTGEGNHAVLPTGGQSHWQHANVVHGAIRLGVQGIVLKEMASSLLVDAMREVHRGAQWLEKGLGAVLEATARTAFVRVPSPTRSQPAFQLQWQGFADVFCTPS